MLDRLVERGLQLTIDNLDVEDDRAISGAAFDRRGVELEQGNGTAIGGRQIGGGTLAGNPNKAQDAGVAAAVGAKRAADRE